MKQNTKLIVLVRHGESESNKKDPKRGLTQKGIGQVVKTAKEISFLVTKKTSGIISSDTKRTMESSEILSERLGIPILKISGGLRVKNIKGLLSKNVSKEDLTFYYLKKAKKKKLPRTITQPTTITKNVFNLIEEYGEKEVLVIVGNSGGLEAFIFFQDRFRAYKKVRRQLGYGEFIVLVKDK